MDTLKKKQITIKIPPPPITSLVFEGGGIKGLAYAGAFRALKEKSGLLDEIKWVAGTSAGAMTALMVALNYTPDEIEKELSDADFSKFTGGDQGSSRLGAIYGYITKFKNISGINQGIYDGKELYQWVSEIVKKKLGSASATFSDLEKINANASEYKNLLVVVTNADKNKTEVFSWENTPNLQIADSVLISMSIPGYFWTRYLDKDEMRKIDWKPTQEKINKSNHKIIPYVDGGILNNYPIEIFSDRKYWLPEYYGLAKSHHYNPSTLGFRVDTKTEVTFILEEHDKLLKQNTGFAPSLWKPMEYIEDKLFSLLNFFTSDINKVEQYSRVTVGIEDCEIKTTDFNLTEKNKNDLKEEGKKAADTFYNKFIKENSYKKMYYESLTDLKDDHKKIKDLIQTIKMLKNQDKHFYGFIIPALMLKSRLIDEKILELKS